MLPLSTDHAPQRHGARGHDGSRRARRARGRRTRRRPELRDGGPRPVARPPARAPRMGPAAAARAPAAGSGRAAAGRPGGARRLRQDARCSASGPSAIAGRSHGSSSTSATTTAPACRRRSPARSRRSIPKARPAPSSSSSTICTCSQKPAALDALGAIVGNLGPEVTLALGSRSRLTLPIARFREQRLVMELGPRDLAMTRSEAALLLRLAGLELDRDGVETLLRRTEGWPAGLSLAALALGERTGRRRRTGSAARIGWSRTTSATRSSAASRRSSSSSCCERPCSTR